MKTINKIAEQEEEILSRWYSIILEDNGCNLEDTYVVLTYNKKTNYDIESHLSCK